MNIWSLLEDSLESSTSEQPVSKRSLASSSAPQPVRKKFRVRLCARDENTVSKKSRIRASAVDVTTKVAFISCGVDFFMESQADRIRLQMMVRDLFDLGCSMLTIAFEQTANMSLVAEVLKSALAEDAQTVLHSRTTENSLSLWTPSFGACYLTKRIESTPHHSMHELRVIGNFFETKAGNLLIISTVLPVMDTWTIAEALNEFLSEGGEDVQTVLVGGALQCSFVISENVVAKFHTPIDFRCDGLSDSLHSHARQRAYSQHFDPHP